MSRIDDLIAEHCPDGVQFESLGELGSLFSGLTGKSKADFSDGNARYVTYSNVFSGTATDVQPESFVRVEQSERQNLVRRGDVLFTASSESADEVGMSSAVLVEPPEPLYLNSFCFGFRPSAVENLDPVFARYLFRSEPMRHQIIKTGSGVTRINISKERFRRLRIPVPPPAVQRAIAEILEKMEHLEGELEAELEARTRQFEHYRESLFASLPDNAATKARMGQVGEFVRGRRFTKRDLSGDGVPCINFGEIYTHYGTSAHAVISYVRAELAPSLRLASPGDVVIAAVSETVEDICKAVAWLGEQAVAVHDDCFFYRHALNPKFVSYFLQTQAFHAQKARHVARAKVKRISAASLASIEIPVPDREEQDRIVDILDKFDALVNDLSSGLPAEIAARRKQYEYYRDKLLTFEEKTA